MANITLIMGESGTGKSTSIQTLDPKETFVIAVLNKALPFKDYRKNYVEFSKENLQGNYYSSDNHVEIKRVIKYIDEKRPEIKTVVIDDYQYVMANEYMRRAKEDGFKKFQDIGKNAWEIIQDCTKCRDNLYFFVLSHTQTDEFGKSKCKTIGKMLDEKIGFEGMFTVVLHTAILDKKCKFLTQNDGVRIAKSPMGMFESEYIDNDLLYVKEKMAEYLGDVEPAQAVEADKQVIDQQKDGVMLELILNGMSVAETIEQLKERYEKGIAYAKEKKDQVILDRVIKAKEDKRLEIENAHPLKKISNIQNRTQQQKQANA